MKDSHQAPVSLPSGWQKRDCSPEKRGTYHARPLENAYEHRPLVSVVTVYQPGKLGRPLQYVLIVDENLLEMSLVRQGITMLFYSGLGGRNRERSDSRKGGLLGSQATKK